MRGYYRTLFFLFAIAMGYLISVLVCGCTSSPVKEADNYVTSVCAIDEALGMCWTDKDNKVGTPLKDLDTWFCEKPPDLIDMIDRMRK